MVCYLVVPMLTFSDCSRSQMVGIDDDRLMPCWFPTRAHTILFHEILQVCCAAQCYMQKNFFKGAKKFHAEPSVHRKNVPVPLDPSSWHEDCLDGPLCLQAGAILLLVCVCLSLRHRRRGLETSCHNSQVYFNEKKSSKLHAGMSFCTKRHF